MLEVSNLIGLGGQRSRLLGFPPVQRVGAAAAGALTFGNGLFVSVPIPSSGNGGSSPDGINWTVRSFPVVGSGYSDVCAGPGMFTAVGNNSSVAAYSPDGINWTQRPLPSFGNWYSCTYGAGKFVAVGGAPGTLCGYSSDGITWTSATLPVSKVWQGVAYGAGLFVANGVASGSTAYATSPDGVTWTSRTMPGVPSGNRIRFLSRRFFTPNNDGTMFISRDGINWRMLTIPSGSWFDITYGDGLYMLMSADGHAAVSDDLSRWHPIASLASGETWVALAYGAGRFTAPSYSSTKILTIG